MNKKEAYNLGKDRGYSVASWVDVPEVGSRIDKTVDYYGFGDFVTKDNRWDYMEMLCHDAELNGRQYSPFEFVAHELNENENKADMYWDEFDRGVDVGINKSIKEAKKSYS